MKSTGPRTVLTPAPPRRSRRRRWLAVGVVVVLAAGLVYLAVTSYLLRRTAEDNLSRAAVPGLATEITEPAAPDALVNILVVGSDSREGLTPDELRRYTLGDDGTVDGQRSDTMMLVSLPASREHVSIVSFPRDLRVDDGGTAIKLTEAFEEGPEHLVDVIQTNFDIPIHHYVEMAVPGFLRVLDVVGSVEICLREPLVDDKSGADFAPGCHRLTPAQALAFVRSRQGERGDFQRIERQQQFVASLMSEMYEANNAVNMPRLIEMVSLAARSVTVDEDFEVEEMLDLSGDVRSMLDGEVPMVTVPGYVDRVDGRSFVIGYGPAIERIASALRTGRPLDEFGNKDERAQTAVAVWTGGLADRAELAADTLTWSGFPAAVIPTSGDAPASTTVYAVPGADESARWVAAALGAEVAPLPAGVTPPGTADVVVAVGADAPTGDEPTAEETP